MQSLDPGGSQSTSGRSHSDKARRHSVRRDDGVESGVTNTEQFAQLAHNGVLTSYAPREISRTHFLAGPKQPTTLTKTKHALLDTPTYFHTLRSSSVMVVSKFFTNTAVEGTWGGGWRMVDGGW